jgi:peroxiredoxin Q/BCP
MPVLQPGEKVPAFTMTSDRGRSTGLSDYAGKPLVLFFYPKDDTPGCTKEALAFKALKAEFDAIGTEVVGVSKDGTESHQKYKAKYDLPCTLLSDESTETIQKFGAWAEKSMYGKTYMGVERCTFLIDGKGVVVRAWDKVKVDGHAEEVLEAARALAEKKAA